MCSNTSASHREVVLLKELLYGMVGEAAKSTWLVRREQKFNLKFAGSHTRAPNSHSTASLWELKRVIQNKNKPRISKGQAAKEKRLQSMNIYC